MAGLKLTDLQKKFGNNAVVDKLNVDIKDGEFITFLGPSGCGKTTTLENGRRFYQNPQKARSRLMEKLSVLTKRIFFCHPINEIWGWYFKLMLCGRI